MTDPEVPGQGLPAASIPPASGPPSGAQDPSPGYGPPVGQVPAAPGYPPGAQGPFPGYGPPAGQVPATQPPRRRRRWPVITLGAVVVVAALAAGLVIWAPWTPPPVLRPTGLAAGPTTANSISFRWSPPLRGPLPDKYLILSGGGVAGSVAGTVTSYRQAGLTPAATYQYSVVAVRGGKRSPPSATLAVRTLTPPLSQARLQGPWSILTKYSHSARSSRNGALPATFIPACAAGACDVVLHVKQGRYSFTMKLARAGASYTGQTVVNFYRCGPAGSSIPDPTTLKIRIHVITAIGQGQAWVANSLAGSMMGTYHYVSAASFYCGASTYTASLNGAPPS